MKKSYLFLAPGFEEIEALTPVDVMRRAGMEVRTVSITGSLDVTGTHGVTVMADLLISDGGFDDAEWMILPGGLPGAQNLAGCDKLSELLKKQAETGRVAAICASPAMVLAPLGILDGHEATGYPGTEKICNVDLDVNTRVVESGNIITANGPSSALPFALAIVAASLGKAAAEKIASDMLV